MTFYVYMLHCSDHSYYIGHTDNLEKRLEQHQQGSINQSYTFRRRPVTLVHQETFNTREEALSAERQLKGWSRAKKKALIRGDWEEIKHLSNMKRS